MTDSQNRPHHTVYAYGYYGDEMLYEGYDAAAAERAFRAGECEYQDCKMWTLLGNGKVDLQFGKDSKSQWKRT